MNPNDKKIITTCAYNSVSLTSFLILGIFLLINSCSDTAKEPYNKEAQKTVYPSEVISSFFDHWKLILGDGSNAGIANNFEHKDYFYTANDGKRNMGLQIIPEPNWLK